MGWTAIQSAKFYVDKPSTRRMVVVMVTAGAGQIARLNCLAAGADDFLSKPVGPQELLRRVEHQLERHAARIRGKLAAGDPD